MTTAVIPSRPDRVGREPRSLRWVILFLATAQRRSSPQCARPYSLPDTFFNSGLYFLSPFLFHYLLYFILSFLFSSHFSSSFFPILSLFFNAFYPLSPIPSLLSSTFSIPHPHTFLAHFPYFEKIKIGLCDYHAVCASVYPLLTFECPNQSL
jgi:hypothetical protein